MIMTYGLYYMFRVKVWKKTVWSSRMLGPSGVEYNED